MAFKHLTVAQAKELLANPATVIADIRDAISEVSSIESQEMFGAKSEYPYHDWAHSSSGEFI